MMPPSDPDFIFADLPAELVEQLSRVGLKLVRQDGTDIPPVTRPAREPPGKPLRRSGTPAPGER